jgi:hypothetical protein
MADVDYLSPAAQELVVPGQTPCDQANALNQEGLSKDAVKWANASAKKVPNPANPADWEALQAAKAWSADPSPATQKAAALAAEKSGFQTPGAWAAQAAAWSGGAGPTPHAVSGAVLLAAAQAGKPIPPAAAGLAKPELPQLAAELPKLAKPNAPELAAKLAKPELAKLSVPEVPVPVGPDGLALTAPQRAEMAKNCGPFLELGCKIGKGQPV